ncbi:MAG TPA: NTP transferase domain-containing protein [Anaerolineales bacterium]|nr:NTP transferase domain-containing protein [Anaerolineales bacterium]
MDIIIPAGGIPKSGNPLYPFTQGKPKALLDIAGKPMIQWVLDAVSEAKSVGHVAVVGLDGSVDLSCKKPLSVIPNHYNMVENLRAGARQILELNPSAEYVMTCTSDIPMVTPEAFDWIVKQAQTSRHEFYLTMITKEAMMRRYPGSKRRTDRFTDIEVRGADITVVEPRIILQSGISDTLKQLRHNTWKQLLFIGFDTLLLIRLGRLDLAGFAKRLAKKHGLDWSPLVCPFPEIAMDVDFPQELELARHVLSKNGFSH